MSTISAIKAQLEKRLDGLSNRIKTLADTIAAVNDKTRRGGGTVTFGISPQTLEVVWSKPFPDDKYGIWATLITATPAQVHWTYAPITKTATGVTLTVTAASAVGDVIVDVLAERTT